MLHVRVLRYKYYLIIEVNMIAFLFQEYRSDKSVEAIKKLVPPGCHW